MNALDAIKFETARSFDFRGRSGRASYLFFLSFWTSVYALVLYFCIIMLSSENIGTAILLTTALFYVPITSAGVRRLHDVGKSGDLMLDPLKPIIGLGLLFIVLAALIGATDFGTGIALVSFLFFGKAILAILAFCAIVAVFLSLAAFSNTMGILLLPSQPGPNKYGPNPNEVPQ